MRTSTRWPGKAASIATKVRCRVSMPSRRSPTIPSPKASKRIAMGALSTPGAGLALTIAWLPLSNCAVPLSTASGSGSAAVARRGAAVAAGGVSFENVALTSLISDGAESVVREGAETLSREVDQQIGAKLAGGIVEDDALTKRVGNDEAPVWQQVKGCGPFGRLVIAAFAHREDSRICGRYGWVGDYARGKRDRAGQRDGSGLDGSGRGRG